MSTLKERISWLMHEYGLTQKQLADIAGIKQPSVAGWVSGRTKAIKAESAMRLAQKLPINATWLVSGEGDAKRPGAGSVQAYLPYEETPPTGMVAVREYRLEFSAGYGSTPSWEELHESTPYWIQESWLSERGLMADRCRIGRVHGDSMEPTLCDRDKFLWYDELTYVPGCVHITDGKIYVLSIDGDLRIKRLQRIKNGIQVLSDNPDFTTERYVGEECEHLSIFGRVYKVLERDL